MTLVFKPNRQYQFVGRTAFARTTSVNFKPTIPGQLNVTGGH